MSQNSTKTQNKQGVVQDVVIIMDSSGSMSAMKSEPLEVLNNFINEQKTVLGDDGATLSLWMFSDKVRLLIDDKPLKEVEPISEYTPDGMTALYDAIGKAVTLKYNKSKHKNVICLVITDGQENSSREFSLSAVKTIINTAEKEHGWKFIFMGANDIFTEGAKTGFNPGRCVSYAPSVPGNLTQLSRDVSHTVARYRCVTSQGAIDADLQFRQQSAPARISRSNDTAARSLMPLPVPPPPRRALYVPPSGREISGPAPLPVPTPPPSVFESSQQPMY